MSHTRSARLADGSHNVEIRNYGGDVVHAGNYPTMREADAVCSHWERLVTQFPGIGSEPVQSLDDLILSDDELLRELEA